MNHLIFLDARAGELEKILSGVKTMLVKNIYPAQLAANPVNPGDSLYFLKDQGDCTLRVKATVVRVLSFSNCFGEDLSHILKEMQPKLQLTEQQYNHWSVKAQILLVEVESAQKISAIQVTPNKIVDRSDWIPFETFNLIAK